MELGVLPLQSHCHQVGRGSEICLPLECSEGSPEWQRLKALFSAVPQGNIGNSSVIFLGPSTRRRGNREFSLTFWGRVGSLPSRLVETSLRGEGGDGMELGVLPLQSHCHQVGESSLSPSGVGWVPSLVGW